MVKSEEEGMNDGIRMHEDVVVLVPGFLGFSILGQFPYFADSVPATLQALLRERWNRDVSVVSASTVPTGPLKARVRELLRFLGELGTRGAARFYLVGHSTGGVDAQLLMTSRGRLWAGEDRAELLDAVRSRVQSVVTISAPHYGTCLLDSLPAEFLAHPRLQGALPFFKASGPLFSLAFKDVSQLDKVLDLSSKQLPDAMRFVLSVMRHHELLDELKPASMEALRGGAAPGPGARVTCFVTGADATDGPPRSSDPFYKELVGFGHVDDNKPPSAEVQANVARIRDQPDAMWIRSSIARPFHIEPGTGDGVVNTARQLLPYATLGGVIVADHADVLGDYDRFDIATRTALNTGIFRSGAGFGDDQFVELYRRVADALSPRVADSSGGRS